MKDFFDSDIVQKEAEELEKLKQLAYEIMSAGQSTKIDQLNYIYTVRELIQKQQIFYTRLKLSDDPRAVDMCNSIEEGARMLYGVWDAGNVMSIMANMLDTLEKFEEYVIED